MKKVMVAIVVLLLTSIPLFAADRYVCKSGEGAGATDGTDWDNCYNGFSDIVWTNGNTYYLDGGASGNTFTNDLDIGVDNVTIRPGQDSNHNGVVTISGGNIWIDDYSDITINGQYGTGTDKYGEGARHIKIYRPSSHGIYGVGSNDNLKILYVEIDQWNYGGSNRHGIFLHSSSGQSSGIEIAYTWVHDAVLSNYDSCDGIKAYPSNSSYGANSIHHTKLTDIVDDGFELGNGWDVYDCYIDFGDMSKSDTVRPSNHPDGILNHGGFQYLRVYNTYVANFPSYLLYSEGRNRKTYKVQVYNSIFAMTYSLSSLAYQSSRGPTFSQKDYGAPGDHQDVLFANNIFVGIHARGLGFVNNLVGDADDIVIKNNIFIDNIGDFTLEDSGSGNVFEGNIIDSGSLTWEGSTRTIAWLLANKSWTNYDEAPTWVSYTPQPDEESPAVTNDYNLHANDTVAKDKGVTISEFSTDADGNSRPFNSIWDIGPYEYGSGTPASGFSGVTIGELMIDND